MSKIKFESHIQKQNFLNVLKGFINETFEVEVRFDPLLKNTSIYNRLLKGKIKAIFAASDEKLIEDIVKESSKNCILCDSKIEKSTPKYPDELIGSGRIRKGEAILFPNLFPISKYHAVISISKSHFLKPNEYSQELISDAILASQLFVKAVYKNDTSTLYTTLNANYLFTAGASFVHPHFQLLISTVPYSYHKRLIEASLNYYKENNSNYYNDLIIEEKKINQRYIEKRGNWHWIAPFAPTGVNEIMGIHEFERDFTKVSSEDIYELSSGISDVLAYYESIGFLSFNFTLFSVRSSSENKGLNCLIKIMTRQNPYQNYRNDDYYLQKILNSELIITLPEELAQGLKNFKKP